MAHQSMIAMALASPDPSIDAVKARGAGGNTVDAAATNDKLAPSMLTPPNSISPDLPAHANAQTPPSTNIEHEMDIDGAGDGATGQEGDPPSETAAAAAATPLSKGALSGLDASAAITSSMLAKHHLPGIMLGNGPKPIRYVMGELTQSVPGFSRIPPAKARRLVVAALENRSGGGVDGNVAFCKTGWGRWDAHIKGSSRDSGVGSFNDAHFSPPRSERSGYAVSNGDSGVHMTGPPVASRYRDQPSGGSWTASSIREQDEIDMDMDMPEHEADKMSMDGDSDHDFSSSMNDDTDDDDWAAVGAAALRKASLPAPNAPRTDYNALSVPRARPSDRWSRRPSGLSQRLSLSASYHRSGGFGGGMSGSAIDPSTATPEEQTAVAALLSMGSMGNH